MPSADARRTPGRADLEAAMGRTIPDVVAPDLNVLFCGINPGRYSGATGFHFAGPGNRFWQALHDGGFTARVLRYTESHELLAAGCGITNLVARTTATAAELSADELQQGRRRLAATVRRYRPTLVAIVGIGAYRQAFGQPRASLGPQDDGLEGAELWALPNPSGLNAHYQAPDFARWFRALHRASVAASHGGRLEIDRKSAGGA